MTLEEQIAKRKAERESLYRLDEQLGREARERRKDVEVTTRLIHSVMASPICQYRINGPIQKR